MRIASIGHEAIEAIPVAGGRSCRPGTTDRQSGIGLEDDFDCRRCNTPDLLRKATGWGDQMNSPAAGWPFAGQPETVEAIIQALSADHGVGALITGKPGTGKSCLAAQILQQFCQDSHIIQVRCSAQLAHVPYGALNVLLSELEAGSLSHPILMLSAVMQLLERQGNGQPIYLFVDNAAELDDLAGVLIAQLARNGTVRLLMACEDPSRLPGEVTGLWKDGFLQRFEIKPLTFQQSTEWLEIGMKAPLSRTAAHELWTASGGNPLLLRTLATGLSGQGILALRDGAWVLTGRGRACGSEFADLLTARLGPVGDGPRRVLEILSLADGMSLQGLLDVVEADDVDELEKRGVVDISRGWPRHARIGSRILSEAVRCQVPLGRSNDLRRLVIGTADALGRPSVQLTYAGWSLDCGEPLSGELALAAAQQANRRSDASAALRFIRAAEGYSAIAEAVTEEVRALMGLGDDDGAQKALSRYHSNAHEEPTLAGWAGLLLAECSLLLRRPEAWGEADSILEKVRVELYPSEPEPALGPDGPDVGSLRQQLALAEAEAASYRGDYARIAPNLERMYLQECAACPQDTQFRLLAGSWLCEAWSLTGRQSDAVALADELLALGEDLSIPVGSRDTVGMRLVCAQLLAGEWDKAGQLLRGGASERTESSLGPCIGTDLSDAVLLCLQGKGSEALRVLQPAISQLRVNGYQDAMILGSAAAAYASVLEEDFDGARSYLRQVQSQSGSGMWLVLQLARYLAALATAGLETPATAVRDMIRLADEGHACGAFGHEMLCLNAAVRLGGQVHAQRLLDAATAGQGRFADVCRQYASGILTGDSFLLLGAARCALDMGDYRLALAAAQTALEPTQEPTDRSVTRDASFLVDECRKRIGIRPVGPDQRRLTAREMQVAMMAVEGTSNKAIAGRLQVSVRTVEGHLYQIFAKLQIAGRAELGYATGRLGEG